MPMDPKKAYDELVRKVRNLHYITSVRGLMVWDQRTYMPKKAAKFRGLQYAAIAEYAHSVITSPEFVSLLEQAERGDFSPGSREAMNLYWLRRTYNRTVKVPLDLRLELIRTTTETEVIWREAKEKDDPSLVLPNLGEIVRLKREIAEHLGYETEPYDALLDDYEPGLRAKRVEEVFSYVREGTVALLRKVMEARESGKVPKRIEGKFPVIDQRRFHIFMLREIGYDLNAGRLDETTHPFAVRITPGDVRITTRYKEDDVLDGVFSTLHEMGHALYNMGLPEEWFGEPVGNAPSLAVHESQSRFWENVVGRSGEFWEGFYPFLQAFLPTLYDYSLEDFLFAANDMKPSFVRIEADELTYNLHIILRFEIERNLINGKMEVKDLPDAWNSKFKEMFGVEPPTHREGFLQDIHWYSGSFGYFPTYTFGNVIAAQIRAKIMEDIDLYSAIRDWDFASVLSWLRERIHSHGALYLPEELVKRATGEGPNPKYLMEYLREKVERFYS